MKRIFKKIKHSAKKWEWAFVYAAFTFAGTVSAYGQAQHLESAFTNSAQHIKNYGKQALQLIEILIALAAVVMLAINFMSRKDGEQNSNDAIVSWLKRLIYTFIGILVIEKLFFN